MADVIEINDINALGAYRMTWNALFAETPGATFFQTFDWLSNYWNHFGEGQKLRVLIVRAAGKPIGIVALCVRRQRHKLGVLRTLCYPLDGWGNVFGPIGPSASATLAMAMKHLAGSPRDWDRIELDWVAHDSTDRGRTLRAMNHAGLKATLAPGQTTSVLDVSEGWEAYLGKRSSKTRHETRRVLRRLSEVEGMEYVRHRPAPFRDGGGDPCWALYEQCEEVAAASWQSGVHDGNTLSHPKYREFYRDTHTAAARLGMLDMNVLRIEGHPVAFSYNYVLNGNIVGLRMGYDSSRSKHGAGIGLLALMLRDSCRRGDERYDLGVGNQKFKQKLRTSVQVTNRVTHVPLVSFRSQAMRLGQWLQRKSAAV